MIEGFLLQHGEVAAVLGALAVAVWRGRGWYDQIQESLRGVNSRLDKINGQAAENTQFRRQWQADPPLSASTFEASRVQREADLHIVQNHLDIMRRQNQALLDDLNERRVERGLQPIMTT